MAVTYTFENIVINGVDTSKTYSWSTRPLMGIKRIICNGEDKLHKDADFVIQDPVTTIWGTPWVEAYRDTVLKDVTNYDKCVASCGTYTIGGVVRGITIDFELPVTCYYSVEENDTVAGGWISYESETVKNISHIDMGFQPTATGQGYDTLEIYFNHDLSTKRVIKAGAYELGLSDLRFEIKGRVY